MEGDVSFVEQTVGFLGVDKTSSSANRRALGGCPYYSSNIANFPMLCIPKMNYS